MRINGSGETLSVFFEVHIISPHINNRILYTPQIDSVWHLNDPYTTASLGLYRGRGNANCGVAPDAIFAFNHTIPTTFFYNAHEKTMIGGRFV
jgi:hypothetical protein